MNANALARVALAAVAAAAVAAVAHDCYPSIAATTAAAAAAVVSGGCASTAAGTQARHCLLHAQLLTAKAPAQATMQDMTTVQPPVSVDHTWSTHC